MGSVITEEEFHSDLKNGKSRIDCLKSNWRQRFR